MTVCNHIDADRPIQKCRCRSEWITLPRYSSSMVLEEQNSNLTSSCMCSARRPEVNIDTNHPHQRNDTAAISRSATLPVASGSHGLDRIGPAALDHSNSSALEPGETDMDSLYHRNTQFARLVSGQESEFGEAPPKYDEIN